MKKPVRNTKIASAPVAASTPVKTKREVKPKLPKVRAIGVGIDAVIGAGKAAGVGVGKGVVASVKSVGTFFKEINAGRKAHQAQRLSGV